MADNKCAFLCDLAATTFRSRPGDLSTLVLCPKCAQVWDTATRAAKAEVEAATDDQVRILFEAVRYIVHNTMPATMAGDRIKTRLVKQLTEIVNLGVVS